MSRAIRFTPPQMQPPWWRAEVAPQSPNAPFARASITINGSNIDGSDSGASRLAATYPQAIDLTGSAYDGDGNLRWDGRNSYSWDAEGRLTFVWTAAGDAADGMVIYFRYDAKGRRIYKSVMAYASSTYQELYTEYYLYDGWNLAGRYRRSPGTTSVMPCQTYVWGPDVSGTLAGAGGVGGLLMVQSWQFTSVFNPGDSQPGWQIDLQTDFPAYDGNGNIMALVRGAAGSGGVIDAQYEYDPFGRLLRASGTKALDNPFRFSTMFHRKIIFSKFFPELEWPCQMR